MISKLNHQRYILLLRALSAVTKQSPLEGIMPPGRERARMLPASVLNGHHFSHETEPTSESFSTQASSKHYEPPRAVAGEDMSGHPCWKSSHKLYLSISDFISHSHLQHFDRVEILKPAVPPAQKQDRERENRSVAVEAGSRDGCPPATCLCLGSMLAFRG